MLLRRRHRHGEPAEVSAPAGSAKKAEWYAYAVHVGVSVEDLDGLTRDQIKEVVAAATADPESEAKAAAELAKQEAEKADAEAKEKADAEAAEAEKAAAALEATGETIPEVDPTEPTE